MKKKIGVLVISFLCIVSGMTYAQQLSVIRGKWVDASKSSLGLYKVQNGDLERVSTSVLDKDGRLAFAFYPDKEGFYVLGTSEKSPINRYVFYLKPGDNLQFQINENTWMLSGDNTAENREMEKWYNLLLPLEKKAVYFLQQHSTYKDFFPQFESTLGEINTLSKAATSNKVFNEAFENYKRYNLIDIALMFTNTPRSEHPKNDEYIDFYRKISIPELTKSLTLLDYPGGVDLIERAYRNQLFCDTTLDKDALIQKMKSGAQGLLNDLAMIPNDVIKGEVALTMASRCKTYPGIMEFKKQNEKYLVTEQQKQRFNMLVAKLNDNSDGHLAIDFRFPDINGKEVALSDFKGKVVYVDVWATWCGPCRQEIPHLIKLEEEYRNKDIIFISVSTDAQKDMEKWKNMVKENGMKGVQLFSGNRSREIQEPYKIKGIPRFILVGKDGNLIAADSPRPSSDEIRPLINAALAK